MTIWLNFFNFLHFIGLAFGLGGATIMTIISAKAEKQKEIAIAMRQIGPSIVKIIWIGLLLLIISGIALPFYIEWPLDKKMLLIKHVFVVWIIIVGFFLGFSSRKMNRLAPKEKEKPSLRFLKVKGQMKVLGIINMILWYLVTLLSVFV